MYRSVGDGITVVLFRAAPVRPGDPGGAGTRRPQMDGDLQPDPVTRGPQRPSVVEPEAAR
jgi:hypothetical protein